MSAVIGTERKGEVGGATEGKTDEPRGVPLFGYRRAGSSTGIPSPEEALRKLAASLRSRHFHDMESAVLGAEGAGVAPSNSRLEEARIALEEERKNRRYIAVMNAKAMLRAAVTSQKRDEVEAALAYVRDAGLGERELADARSLLREFGSWQQSQAGPLGPQAQTCRDQQRNAAQSVAAADGSRPQVTSVAGPAPDASLVAELPPMPGGVPAHIERRASPPPQVQQLLAAAVRSREPRELEAAICAANAADVDRDDPWLTSARRVLTEVHPRGAKSIDASEPADVNVKTADALVALRIAIAGGGKPEVEVASLHTARAGTSEGDLAEARHLVLDDVERERTRAMLDNACARDTPLPKVAELQAVIEQAVGQGLPDDDPSLVRARQALAEEQAKAMEVLALEHARARLRSAIGGAGVGASNPDELRDAMAAAIAAGLPQANALLAEARRCLSDVRSPSPLAVSPAPRSVLPCTVTTCSLPTAQIAAGPKVAVPPRSAPQLIPAMAPTMAGSLALPPCVGASDLPSSETSLTAAPLLDVLDVISFGAWRAANPGELAHLKGFASGTSSCYDSSALRDLWSCSVLSWGGEAPVAAGFTSLVVAFLREKPRRKAVAFCRLEGIERFRSDWLRVAHEFKGRIAVVAVDLERDAEAMGLGAMALSPPERERRELFLLGRVALRATGSKRVVALGGDSVVALEAEASMPENVFWTVYALGRGRKEEEPSLMDWALSKKGKSFHLKFVYWKDPLVADAFAEEVPPVARVEVMDLAMFGGWRNGNRGEIVHLKGFSTGMSSCYTEEALAQLSKCSILAWDGEPPDPTGFTSLIAPFLRGSSDRRALAFRRRETVDAFLTSWQDRAPEFTGRLAVVVLDFPDDLSSLGLADVESESTVAAVPRWARDSFVLGRAALRASGAKQVVALGGAAALAEEAKLSFEDGVTWTVFFASRDNKREQQGSIMDWAVATPHQYLTAVYGRDPFHGSSFARAVP